MEVDDLDGEEQQANKLSEMDINTTKLPDFLNQCFWLHMSKVAKVAYVYRLG